MDSAPKRMKTCEAFRMKRIRDLEEDVVDLNDRITRKGESKPVTLEITRFVTS